MSDRRAVRRVIAASVLLLGLIDLADAAAGHAGRRRGVAGVGWLVDAVVGSRYVLLVAGVMSIVVSRGLLHGKRNAWRVALFASVLTCVAREPRDADAAALIVGAIVAGGLLVTRRVFGGRSDPAMARRGLQVLVLGEAAVFVYGMVGIYGFDRNFRASTTLVESAEYSVRLLLLLPASAIVPITRNGQWLIDSVRVAGLAVMLAALARLVATVVQVGENADRRDAQAILDHWATGPLAPFALRAGNSWLIGDDRRSLISFKVIGSSAIALGEPIGAPDSCCSLVDEFLELCTLNGWTPAFHQVANSGLVDLRVAGLKLLKIGEEAIVDVQTWTENDRGLKSLRSALRRIERLGLFVEELTQPIDDATMADLRTVSDSWLNDGHRERTFSVGQFDPTYLRATTVLALRDSATGRIVAFTNVLPAYRSSIGNFDLMRRHVDAPNGAIEALFVAMIKRFRQEGRHGMTLGLVPFVNVTGNSLADRAVRLLWNRGDDAFHAHGLRAFKQKWQPHWEARYLAYPTDHELPKVAAAVARAGELPRSTGLIGRTRRVVHLFPVSLTIITTIVWLMAVTAIDQHTYRPLLRHFGLGWHDLQHGQLWRLATSQLLETRPGFVWANVALTLIVLPITEWRVGSRRCIAAFFICDWFSTLLVLAVVRIAAFAHNPAAIHVISRRDTGPSAGAWALTVVIAMSISNRAIRRSTLGAIAAFLLLALAVNHRLFDVQHLVAAVAGFIVGVIASRRGPQRARRPASVVDTRTAKPTTAIHTRPEVLPADALTRRSG